MSDTATATAEAVAYTSAIFAPRDAGGRLAPNAGRELQFEMHNSDGTGEPLVKHEKFGADLVRFKAGKGVAMHVHEGSHILFCLDGKGFVDYGPQPHQLSPGVCYLVPGLQPHAIRATTDLLLIAVGDDYRPVDSPARLDMVDPSE